MTEIVRRQSPSATEEDKGTYAPWQLNADLATAKTADTLINKWPLPAIDTRKFTIINGLMKAINHRDPEYSEDKKTLIDKGNLTFIDVSVIIGLMGNVSKESVNVEGKLFNSVFAYLMHPKYIIQGMPQATTEEQKPSALSRLVGMFTGKRAKQEGTQK